MQNNKACAPYGHLTAIIVPGFPFEISSPRFACLGGLSCCTVPDDPTRLCVWLGIKLSRFPSSLRLFTGARSRSPQPYVTSIIHGITWLNHRNNINLNLTGLDGHAFIGSVRSTHRLPREVG